MITFMHQKGSGFYRNIWIHASCLWDYGICFIPALIAIILTPVITVPTVFYVTSQICLLFITVANPIVQSYFRPEIKNSLRSFYQKLPCFVSVWFFLLNLCVLIFSDSICYFISFELPIKLFYMAAQSM